MCTCVSFVLQTIFEIIIGPVAVKAEEMKSGTAALGLFMLLLVKTYQMIVPEEFIQKLCRYLLLRPNMNNTTCVDMDIIASHFPSYMANKR